MSRYTYPHTIDNGAGESLTFVRRVPGRSGERVEVENVVRPGTGPPMHIHRFQEEALTVREGRIGYQSLGQPERFGGPGDTVVFKAAEAHRFWNAGDVDLKCAGYVDPADNIEFFLGAIYESTKRSGGHRPDPFDAAYLMTRYRSEFTMVEIPAFVLRVVFPVQMALGHLLGKYRRYADAPEPVRR